MKLMTSRELASFLLQRIDPPGKHILPADPDFNDCLDGLIMVDVYNIPAEFVNALSRDQSEESIRERFRGEAT